MWPHNLTLPDIYYFWAAPTLCYELNFPRTSRVRTTFLIRRAVEVVVGLNLVLAIVQQVGCAVVLQKVPSEGS